MSAITTLTYNGISDRQARDYVHTLTAKSGTSFYWAMRLLPKPRRDAMFAIYGFCREVDDIADGPGEIDEKLAALGEWRHEIDRLYGEEAPTTLVGRALVEPLHAYALQKEDFLAIIAGMESDARPVHPAPLWKELELYCDRVAGAVGLLAIRVFGDSNEAARHFALHLGMALQLTNILRDVAEDAAEDRLYLPVELLRAAGIDDLSPASVLGHPALEDVCRALARRAQEEFAEAERLLDSCVAEALRPAIVMMEIYRRILDRLFRRGWRQPALFQRARVPGPIKLMIAVRYGLF